MGTASSSIYNKVGFLGKGAFGKVYKVEKDGKFYAMKEVCNVDEASSPIEVEILRSVKHERIITYYQSFLSDDGCLNIVMEFADYGMMSSFVRKHSSDWKNNWGAERGVWRMIGHLSAGLKYLHAFTPKPILHCDLKPDNILGVAVHEGGKDTWCFKLADFGIAKLLTANAQMNFYTTHGAGTAIYMAPEVIRACFVPNKYTFSADMWSLGAVISFYCNGVDLFSNYAMVLGWQGEASGLPSHYSLDLRRLNARLLDPNPKKRPTAAEVRGECTNERKEVDRH